MIVSHAPLRLTLGGGGSDLTMGAIRFFNTLRALKTTVLAIDHLSSDDVKRGKGSSKPFGSVFKLNSARNAFELRDVTDPQDPFRRQRLVLIHRKANLGPKVPDLTLDYEWTEDHLRIRRSDTAFATRPINARIIEALMSAPASVTELRDVLNESPGEDQVNEYEVRTAVAALVRSEEVTSASGLISISAIEPPMEAPLALGLVQ